MGVSCIGATWLHPQMPKPKEIAKAKIIQSFISSKILMKRDDFRRKLDIEYE
jgi:hypothetical protein